MKLKKIILVLVFILLVSMAYAITTEFISPADNTYLIVGGTIDNNFTTDFIVNCSPTGQNSTLNATFWSNDGGTWAARLTNTTQGAVGGETTYGFDATNVSFTVTDDSNITWGVQCCDNATCTFTENRTVFIEDAPVVTLNLPANNSIKNTSSINFNITATGDDDYSCYIYSNYTGTWAAKGPFTTVYNATSTLLAREITEGNSIWNAICYEKGTKYPNVFGWSTGNISLTVDKTVPTVTIISPADNTYSNNVAVDDGYNVLFNINVTDTNPDVCLLKINEDTNYTVTSITSGTAFNMYLNASDGDINWSVICNDTGGNTVRTSNRNVSIDTVYPYIIGNFNYTSTTADCKGFTQEINFTESVNYSITYGTTVAAGTHTVDSASYLLNQTPTITFNDTYETTYYMNVTACDPAGNCNTTAGGNPQLSAVSPVGLCTGWSLWSIYDRSINLSSLFTDSGANYVYWWNTSSQVWLAYSSGDTTSGASSLGIGDVVQLYESTNTTWYRNNTGTPNYHVNITSGHNFLGLYNTYSFGNLSTVQFRNETGGNQTIWGIPFQIDYYDGYNNSDHRYVSNIYRWTWNNVTQLGTHGNSLDTLHVYSAYNISMNMTATGAGFVYGNWSD